MAIENFAVFILTHGRADNVLTYATLRRQGYTGPIYLVVDDGDKQLEQYQQRYGDQVVVFSKTDYVGLFDIGDNLEQTNTVTFARNAMWDIARQCGVDYFLELDDDYHIFKWKYTGQFVYAVNMQERKVLSLDRFFQIMLEFYQTIPAASIAMAQGGDFIGGKLGQNGEKLWMKRKVMNSFFCSTSRPFRWYGRMNDDVNTYLVNGNRGAIFGTILNACLEQARTQANAGGLTEMYLQLGTYVKSFYTVMFGPSYSKVYPDVTMNRLHHRINWNAAVPCIVSERHCKRLARAGASAAVAAD